MTVTKAVVPPWLLERALRVKEQLDHLTAEVRILGDAPERRLIEAAFERARASLEEAVERLDALTVGRRLRRGARGQYKKTTPRTRMNSRKTPLKRCRHCDALVWSHEQMSHVADDHGVTATSQDLEDWYIDVVEEEE